MNASKTTSTALKQITLLVAALFASGSALAAPFAYVPNEKDGTISVIDTATDTVTGTLPAKGSLGKKIQGLMLDAKNENLFVVDASGGAVKVINLATRKVVKKIVVGESPEGISLSPDGKTLAVCMEEEHQVSLVNTETLKLTRKIKTQGKNPEHCVFF